MYIYIIYVYIYILYYIYISEDISYPIHWRALQTKVMGQTNEESLIRETNKFWWYSNYWRSWWPCDMPMTSCSTRFNQADFVQSESIFQSTLIFNHGPRALQGSGNGSTTTMSTRDPSTHIGCRIFWRWINHPIKRGRNWPNSGLSQIEALFFQTSSFCHMWPVKTVSLWSQTHGSCLEIWRRWTLTC